MKCSYVQNNINHYFERLIEGTQALGIERHIENCSRCAKEYASYEKMISLLREHPVPLPADEQWSSLHDSIIAALPMVSQPENIIHFPFSGISFSFPSVRNVAALFIIALAGISGFMMLGSLRNGFSITPTAPSLVMELQGDACLVEAATGNATVIYPQGEIALLPGNTIQTEQYSSLKLQMSTNTTIEIGEKSRFSVSDHSRNRTVLALKNGGLNARVSKRKKNQLFRIETPNAFCEVIGTRFDVTTFHDAARDLFITTLKVEEGTVKFGSGDNSVRVKAGNAVAILGDSIGSIVPADDPQLRQLREYPGMGKFQITSVPSGAEVIVDDTVRGHTPLSGHASTGTRSVHVKKGRLDWAGSIRLDPSSVATLDVQLNSRKALQENTQKRTGSDPSDNPILARAIQLILTGRYEKALDVLHTLTEDMSISSRLRAAAMVKTSLCHKNLGNYEAAVSVLRKIIEGGYPADQKDFALFEAATINKTLLHDPGSAIDDLRRYTEEFRNGIWIEEATYSLAELLHLTKRYREAVTAYEKYCSTYPKSPKRERALYTLGAVYSLSLGQYERAGKAYAKLIEEYPSSRYIEDAVFWSADCLFRQGHASSALRQFTFYVHKYPNGRWANEAKTRLKKIETAEAR